MNQMSFTILLAKYLKTKYFQQPDLEYRFSMKGRFFAIRFISESIREQTVVQEITIFEREMPEDEADVSARVKYRQLDSTSIVGMAPQDIIKWICKQVLRVILR